MRDLILEEPASDRARNYYDSDLELIFGEIDRVRVRHDHRLGWVQRLS